jgi:beta-galactosidase/beta-glucuronidase
MNEQSLSLFRIDSVRPLVRYVDEARAIVEVRVSLHPPVPTPQRESSHHDPAALRLEVLIGLRGPDGCVDEHAAAFKPGELETRARFEIVCPERWWPAGMGRQALYNLRVTLLAGGEPADERLLTIGLTSVRGAGNASPRGARRARPELLVNGQVCDIETVVPIDLVHERRLLPVAGHSLLVVRDHYGPDVLYDAADRAGLLLIQCVPIDAEAQPERDVEHEVDRLVGHPSLAGWYVGHLGRMSEQVERTIRLLDPTRGVFRDVPGA